MDASSTARMFAPSTLTLDGRNADIYFERSRRVLEAQDLDPSVVAEVFTRRHSMLCGMKEAHALLRNVLPPEADVWSLADGDMLAPKEVALRIEATYRSFCIYETAILGMLASGSGWATGAHEIIEAAGEVPVVSFGARHLHPDVSGRMEYAACLAGCVGCATTWGAELFEIEASGTLPHALILVLGDTLAAATAFDQVFDTQVKRIILVDTFRDEVEESLRIAQALGDRLWGVRLDTPSERGGVTIGLVRAVRSQLDEAGHHQVRIVVSGGLDVERITQFRAAAAPVDMFGVGSAISGAPPIDFTMDLKQVDGRPVAKRGRIPGITQNDRLQQVELGQHRA